VRCSSIVSDGAGGSRFDEIDIEMQLGDTVEGLPSMLGSLPWPTKQVFFMHIRAEEAGAPYPWHPAPDPRLIICLQGLSQQETTDGDVRTFGPGEMFLTVDLDGRGHRSTNFGETRYAIALLDGDPTSQAGGREHR
jgi:hypothetical protein